MPEQLTLDALPPSGATATLRPYQADAVAACLDALARGEHPVLSLPTGSGKSMCIAALCAQLEGRILIATHRQELLVQDTNTLAWYGLPSDGMGIYSAALARREADARIVVGGIQSIYRRMVRLQAAGDFAYIIVDECHRCPEKGQPSMYGTVFEACDTAQRIGVTATPYRLDSGLLHEGEESWFDAMPVNVGMRELTPAYLAPLVGVMTAHDIDVSQVRSRAGEFVTGDLSQAACEEAAITGALDELCLLAKHRGKWLVFCVDVTHTRLVTEALVARGIVAEYTVGTTDKDARQATLARFRASETRALVNCELYTTGMDVPGIDCIVMLRPSQSKSLVVQCLGRGTRKAYGKENCLVVDFAGNLTRHVPLDELSHLTKSPERQAAEDKAERQEAVARERLAKHRQQASLTDPMHAAPDRTPQTYQVEKVTYRLQEAKKFSGRFMLLVSYLCPSRLRGRYVTTFLCLEHTGWACIQAGLWFVRRAMRIPRTAKEGLASAWAAPKPTHIVVREDEQFPRVIMEHFTEKEEEPPWTP